MWLIEQLLAWTDDGSETWGKYCRASLGKCEYPSCSRLDGKFHDVQPPWLSACGIHTFTSFVHLLFLAAWLLSSFWTRLSWFATVKEDDGMKQRRLKRPHRKRFTRKLVGGLVGCSILSLQYIGLAVYGLVRARSGGDWPLHAEVADVIHSAVWALLGLITYYSWRRKEESFPSWLRTWWIVGSLLSLLTLVSNYVVTDSWDIRVAVVETCMIPVCVFLFLLAVSGISEKVEEESSDPLEESLLGEQKEQDESPAQGPGITPYADAGYFSRAALSWLSPLIAKGAKKPLEIDDVPLLAPGYRAHHNYARFKENWVKELETREAKSLSFYKAIGRTFWRMALFNAAIAGVTSVAAYVGPYLIEDFVEYLAGRRRFPHEGVALVSFFFLSKVVEILTQRQWYLGMQSLGLNLKSALTAFVYHKGLVLSNQARQGHTSGEIINYVTVDVERLGTFSWYFQDIWILPLQICLALLILFKTLGIAALASLVASVFTVLMNVPLNILQDGYQDNLMEAKDKRMKSLTESLRSMRILKLQAWDTRYLSKLEDLRDAEYGWLKKTAYIGAAITFVFWTAPIFVSVATFGTCALMGVSLTTGKILSALAVFITMTDPLSQLPELFSMISQTKVSADRLQTYLLEEELQEDAVIRECPAAERNMAVDIRNGEFKWDSSSENSTLQDINVQVDKGQRVAICGTVGSGKSSLLSCLLGEIRKVSGTVTVSGATAYVAQSSWIQSGKVEENILFGSSMDRRRYEETLRVCCLEKDMELFAYGDQTVIGERGINMSGGQKQRIQLARAVYQNADIYLLDDPFSAVDAHTGSEIFTNCILRALSSKTVIYVTHQMEFLSAADLVLVLRDGKIVQSGKYDELLQTGAELSVLVDAHTKSLGFMNASGYDKVEVTDETLRNGFGALGDPSRGPSLQLTRVDSLKEAAPELERKQLIEEEEMHRGQISFSVYWTYFTSVYKGALIPAILLAQISFQVLQIASNYWMAWSTPASEGEAPKVNSQTLILVYCAFAFGSCLFVCIRALLIQAFGLMAAQKFFKRMMRSVFHAPISFFDSTPNGRVLSRASSDQNTLDAQIMFTFGGVMMSGIQIIGIITVMSQVTWVVLVVVAPVTIAGIWMQQYYIKSARELQRLFGVLKAPIIHHYSESIAGTATIRGFQQEQRFLDTNFSNFDRYGRVVFHNFSAIQWLMLRMESLSTVVFTFCLIYVVVVPVGAMDPGMAGLAVTYGLQLNTMLSWWLWDFCNLDNRVISVERIKQFTDLESEAPYVIEQSRPPAQWPSQGLIEFRNLKVRYNAHSPLVLHGLTFLVPGGQKIGVVGRTGSGKSTLIQTLFRLVEPAGGSILIDGLDIASIGLHDLRSRLSVIPQDPTLFEGSMRFNLDPLEQYSDAEIWEALDKCQLGDVVRATNMKLDFPVSENGENWSVGQRQLLCLGRALLKHTKILVLDEATASVDSTTDGLIQQTIRTEFDQCTVITVAHRIPSVVDSDRVLVLSDGKVAEYDAPVKLLHNKSSLFYKLVSEYSSRSIRSSSMADLSQIAV